MMYTVIPPEMWEAPQSRPEAVCIRCSRGYLEGIRDSRGGLVISRLISTDPAAYLDPGLAPGATYHPPDALC